MVAFQRSGTFAEAIAIPAKYVYEMPNKMTYEEGAALGLCYAAAYMMLYEIGNLTKGKSVLVHSAGGGVVSTWWEKIISLAIIRIRHAARNLSSEGRRTIFGKKVALEKYRLQNILIGVTEQLRPNPFKGKHGGVKYFAVGKFILLFKKEIAGQVGFTYISL